MKSHAYDLASQELGRLFGGPLVAVVSFALLMHGGAAARLWPTPRPTFNTDQTILIHQAEASRAPQQAEVVFLGDSSCLMDWSARDLAATLPAHRVLNLGTLSYLELSADATMLRHYAAANPGRLRVVVVLLHPEMLRGIEPVPQLEQLLAAHYAGEDFCDLTRARGWVDCALGLEVFRGRFLSRVWPVPLRGPYGRYYGCAADLDRFLTEHHGSAVDPNHFVPGPGQGNAEYRLSPKLEAGSRALRAAVPAGVKLIAGITPVPESFALPDHATRREQILAQWRAWLEPDALLTGLPATLPDELFAGVTHLNERGAQHYTRLLAEDLRPHLTTPAPGR